MKRWLLMAGILLVAALALAACGGSDDDDGSAAAAPGQASSNDEVMVDLAEQNDSGESGTATLTALDGDRTRVVVRLTNPTTPSQPAHIHRGSCGPGLDPNPLHGLLNVTRGESETVVNAPLSELTAGGLAINVHHSNSAFERFVACGNLPGGADGGSDDGGSGGGLGY